VLKDARCFAVHLRRVSFTFSVCCLLSFSGPSAAQTASPWLPVAKEDLDLKSNPERPGEPAMILYQEIQADSAQSAETHYTRIKIFTEKGRDYADVGIPYVEKRTEVSDIQARTIGPDGRAEDFTGTIFDRLVIKTRRFRFNEKYFTFANVQPGSILEYRYRIHIQEKLPDVFRHPKDYIVPGAYAYPAAQWTIQHNLFVRNTHLVFQPNSSRAPMIVRAIRLPAAAQAGMKPDGTWQADIANVPAFHEEEKSPPKEALLGRISLFYIVGNYSNEDFWRDLASGESHEFEKFIGKSRAVQEEADRLTAGINSEETKLRKLYDRVQQLRYVTFERSRTEKEQKNENLKPNKNTEEVLTRGYAFGNEANLLFAALARAAGFDANIVRLASRDHGYFLPSVPDVSQLDAEAVGIRTKSDTRYFDPATLYCPFDLLPWEETDAGGIRVGTYSAQVHTPRAKSADAVIERRSSLKLSQDGTLGGRLEVRFLRQEALSRKLRANSQDEAGRRKMLEDEIKEWLPQNSTVKFISATGWTDSYTPLTAEFEIQSPGFGTAAGSRMLVPSTIFSSRLKASFQASRRENPVDLKYSHQEADEISLEIPEAFSVEHLPAPMEEQQKIGSYAISAAQSGSVIKVNRRLVMDLYYFEARDYQALRDFRDFARSNDEEQIVLHTAAGK